MIISGVKCDNCNSTDVREYTDKNTIRILYTTKGWKIDDTKTICPICKMRENAELKNG